MNNSSSSTDLLDQFIPKKKKTGFQFIPNFHLPVYKDFGYVYDKETNRLYIAGGFLKGDGFSDNFYEIEMVRQQQQNEKTTSSSSSSSSLICPRIVCTRSLPHGKGILGCVCAKLYNKIYVIGGWGGGKILKDVYSYDIATSQWEKEASMNTKRYYPSVTLIKGGTAMMLCGGQDASDHSLNTCEEFNPTTKQWTILPSLMNLSRHGHVSFCHESRICVVGGYSKDTKQPLATTEVIDLNTTDPQWIFGPQMVEKRDGLAGCLVGDYVIVGGGYNGNLLLQSCEAIATSGLVNKHGQWRPLHGLEMNKSRCWFGMIHFDNHLVALGGDGTKMTCEALDVSLLLQPEAAARAAEPTSQFYEMLLQQQDERYTLEYQLGQLATLVGDVHEAKVLYTYAQHCVRQGLIEQSTSNTTIKTALERCAETCTPKDAFVIILEKAEEDGIIGRVDLVRFKNRAELERVGAVLIAPIWVAIKDNTRRIEGLECSVRVLKAEIIKLYKHMVQLGEVVQQVHQNVEGLERVKRGFSRRRRLDAALGVIVAIVNAISIGVGGNLLEAFKLFTDSVVDFSDKIHMLEVLNGMLDGAQTEELRQAFGVIKDQFEVGVQLAQGESEEVLADAIAEGNAVQALAAIATLVHEEFSEAQEDFEEVNNPIDGTATTTTQTAAVPESFRDAILSEDDEETCPIHAAVKFADMDTLKEALDESEDEVSSINILDSEGRTALDLAALTGQREMVDLLTSSGGEYKFKNSARMKFMAKGRYSKHQEYLDYLNSIM